ncbi:hypothetical protein BVRB_038880 [Beta vulgaris subsp. vulgaris]|uniref:Uncharacterized protein n=1 Tax=Beta vulgaris subsp. vulgaris TaxID=3555 RepID=A0A0J7YPR4_BETVV|nr:hypothetical protein BVRB_038880 [Beta vulgaris subsp. vulgaris]
MLTTNAIARSGFMDKMKMSMDVQRLKNTTEMKGTWCFLEVTPKTPGRTPSRPFAAIHLEVPIMIPLHEPRQQKQINVFNMIRKRLYTTPSTNKALAKGVASFCVL